MKILFLIFLLSMMGCANTGPKFNESIESTSSDKATVFFYRPSRFVGGGLSVPVLANKKEIGKLDNNSYFKIILVPDKYQIHSQTQLIDRISTMVFLPGEVYFVRAFVDQGMWVSSMRFEQVHKDDAYPEIKKTGIQYCESDDSFCEK